MLSNFDEIFLNEFNSPELDCLFQSSIQTHFDMTNSNDLLLAYSLIKNCVVQIQRINNKELLYLTNNNNQKISLYNNPRVRGPKSTRFTCPICGLITVSMERLQRHVNQHGQILHLETYKPERKISSLICEKCKATFSSSYALRKHQRVHTRGLFKIKILSKFYSYFINR
jgi:transcription elongation factor Elf1